MFRFEDFMRDGIMNNNSQELYESLSNDNPSFVVMKIYEQIKNNKQFKFRKEKKSEIVSEMFRLQGNENFKNKKYGKTLQLYNNALLYAPPNTQAMRLAYSNRSVLLFKCRQYEEALKDIEKCFQLGGYDSEVKEKLEKRKERCDTIIRNGFVQHIVSKKDMQFSQPNIFEMYSKHAEIPGVSKEVHIHAKSESLRVLAAKDIHPGTVVASEIGFITAMTKDYFNISCYYCQNTILNLIPCDNCCVALFCDDNCRKQCLLEYHEIECNLVNRDYDNLMSLVLRAIVKIRNKCADWNEFLKMFDSINQSGGKVDIYNTISSDSKLSLLTDTQHFREANENASHQSVNGHYVQTHDPRGGISEGARSDRGGVERLKEVWATGTLTHQTKLTAEVASQTEKRQTGSYYYYIPMHSTTIAMHVLRDRPTVNGTLLLSKRCCYDREY
ncbi:SET and MYND domain-containing protein 4 [Eumeta japonica]|uniref:SET and MYND domain-containing protein 4 n=1 Tax=Eumeta variegata TaxID=151549 RepID=A0A4C1UMI9_EUMVA|nr:SET and MYND domain-containing protein 4 [Eumeta japonica]